MYSCIVVVEMRDDVVTRMSVDEKMDKLNILALVLPIISLRERLKHGF